MDAIILNKLVLISDSIYRASDAMGVRTALSEGVTSLGFDSFLLSCRKGNKQDLMLDSTFTTFPAEFLNNYDRLQWLDVDPIAERVVNTDRAFTWNSKEDTYKDVRKQSFVDYLQSLRMCSGLVIPFPHEKGMLSAISAITFSEKSFGESTRLGVAIMTNAAMTKVETLGLCPTISADEAVALRLLSDPQMEILKWIAEGKSNHDIATITNTTERAVRYHVGEILRKLGVATRAQATARIFGSPI